MLDLRGTSLGEDERELLLHPLVGGVVLFSRNYVSAQQITALAAEIHALREPRLYIAVDHEGGRIQRFQDDFTRLPSMQSIGRLYDKNQQAGLSLAEKTGWLMAIELRAVDIDFSFAPVLDVCGGNSQIIGSRSFHKNQQCVADLSMAYMHGMRNAGMAAVGKHFPGHGSIAEDSHLVTPVDKRKFSEIQSRDMVPFKRLIDAGIAAIMPAYVIYPEIDDLPAGFSSIWLNKVLRQGLGFQGLIFSDDINMVGAAVAGNYVERAHAALQAGSDIIIICNNQPAAIEVMDKIKGEQKKIPQNRLLHMRGGEKKYSHQSLKNDALWLSVSTEVSMLATRDEDV